MNDCGEKAMKSRMREEEDFMASAFDFRYNGLMSRFLFRIGGLGLFLAPSVVLAVERSIVMNTGFRISFVKALENLITFLAASMVSIATLIFLIGALYLVGSFGTADSVEKGKKLMRYSLTGMAIVLGSYTILRTVLYLLYIT